MFKKLGLLIIIIALIILVFFKTKPQEQEMTTRWKFQSIDTMKYSRDLSREKLNDSSFDEVIDTQVKNIAGTGATHVAIATPYDEEFYPMLKKWVAAARKYHLKVWFRGNWSGWEKWFDYPQIDRQEHIVKTEEFIMIRKDLFENGDVFTACPECENGGAGDPRRTGDVYGFRSFMVEEYKVTKKAFKTINKDVASNFASMNGDVARVVMDRETTAAMDGIITIDHYVVTPEKLAFDVSEISRISGGKVVLGEWGAPISDINGEMTQDQQAAFVKDALSRLSGLKTVEGVNYWTNIGSSTALWTEDGKAKKAVEVISSFYKAQFPKDGIPQ